jgi:hypothetical protein
MTVRGAVAVTPSGALVALMVVVPRATLVASPSLPEALLTVATLGSMDSHNTSLDRSRVLWSEKMPVAMNCWVAPRGIDASMGVTASETNRAGVVINVVVPLMSINVAVMVVEPRLTLVAKP